MKKTDFSPEEWEVFEKLEQLNPGIKAEQFAKRCCMERHFEEQFFTFSYNTGKDEVSLTDISPLAKLERLERLYIYNCAISDLSPISHLRKLQKIHISGNREKLQPCDLTELCNLEYFWYDASPVGTIPEMTGLPKLESVTLIQCGLTDISALAGLPALKSLWISENRDLKSVTALAECPALEELLAYDTGIEDLAPLRGLQRLREITLSGTPIRDVSPLAEIPSLEMIWLYGTPVEDVSCLASLPKLKDINLYKTNVTDISAYQGWKGTMGIERKKLGTKKAKKTAAEVKEAVGKAKEKMVELGIKARPVLKKEQIRAFEERIGAKLPREYTAFLTQIGDGFEQDELPDCKVIAFPALENAKYDPERVTKRFNYKEAWGWEDDENATDKKIAAMMYNGQIHFADCGCGEWYSIILCGSAKGEVWNITDVGAGPYHNGVDFLDWLLDALNDDFYVY
ncbi:MAG: SMI1/KNR4 family protein [Lachnospiraceae bacterium]|nr:SMI1/KNR4 family protein [Lachnospiraceae bacterium]